jgi:hypothetical protein
MIVELKSGGDWKTLCEKTLGAAERLPRDYCVESFHPLLVRWFLPACAADSSRAALRSGAVFQKKRPAASVPDDEQAFDQRYGAPAVIAYHIGPKCLSVRILRGAGAMRVAWTARPATTTRNLTRRNDAIIF